MVAASGPVVVTGSVVVSEPAPGAVVVGSLVGVSVVSPGGSPVWPAVVEVAPRAGVERAPGWEVGRDGGGVLWGMRGGRCAGEASAAAGNVRRSGFEPF